MADRISYGPITLFESDAYKRAKQVEATKREIDLEKAQLDLQRSRQELSKAEGETLSGRVGQADIAASVLEQARQKRMGVEIGQEIGREATKAGGLSLLEATGKQAGINLDLAREQARLGAVEQYGIEKGLTPTAKVDVGGITQTVPAMQAPEMQADMQSRVYNATWPKFTRIYESQGFAPQDAEKMGKDAATKELVKNANSGKINLLLQDGSTLSVDFSRAMQMAKDPTTAPAIRNQLISVLGETEAPKAPNWVKTRLGR